MSWMSPCTVPITTVPRFSRGVAGGDARLQLGGDALHDLAAHDQLGDEDLLAGELLAERGHRRLRIVEDRLRGFARVQAVRHDLQRVVLVHGEDGVGEVGGHAASLLSVRRLREQNPERGDQTHAMCIVSSSDGRPGRPAGLQDGNDPSTA